jgi:hypothetical protein
VTDGFRVFSLWRVGYCCGGRSRSRRHTRIKNNNLSLLHNNHPSTMNLSFNLTKYTGVMAFYAVLTYLLFPAIAYFLFGKTLEAAGNGFIAGSVVSVILWRMVGMGMVRGA